MPESLELGCLGAHAGAGGPDVSIMAGNDRLFHHLPIKYVR